jgi:hypothetical protein
VDTKFLLNLYVDLQAFSNEVKNFFQTIILGQRLTSITSLSSNLTTELSNSKDNYLYVFLKKIIFEFFKLVLDETLLGLTDNCRTNLKNLVIGQLIDRCNETLHSVQDIPRMYRKTNREVSFQMAK